MDVPLLVPDELSLSNVDDMIQLFQSREISVLGSCASSGEYPECIDLLARGAVDVDLGHGENLFPIRANP